jgi:hypothetical protein
MLNRATSPPLAGKERLFSTMRAGSPEEKRKVRKVKTDEVIDTQFLIGTIDTHAFVKTAEQVAKEFAVSVKWASGTYKVDVGIFMVAELVKVAGIGYLAV